MQQPIVQYLDANSKMHGDANKVGLAQKDHRTIFTLMLKVRLFEERCMKLQRQGRIGFYIGAYGQEASHIASAYAFRKQDWIFPSYRELGVMLLRGISMQEIVNQIYGNSEDHTQGAQMPCHHSFRKANFVSISSPIATQIPQAVGMAMAAKYKGDKVIAGVYLGDGGTSEGDFHVAMNFAGVYQAPVVFIVENNQWAISCPAHEQTASDGFAIKAKAYGFEGLRVDGNDVLAVYEATKRAVEKARQGKGPTLIENVTYRLFSHSSSDDASRYQNKQEYEQALKCEPLIRYRNYLQEQGIWNEAWEKEISEDFKKEVDVAIKTAEKQPRPDPSTLFTHVYATSNPLLEEQQRLLQEELKERESWEEEGAFPL